MKLTDFIIQIYADGASLSGMVEMSRRPYVSGLTTNPTLMAKGGVKDYLAFAKDVVAAIPDKPISFEVISDWPLGIRREAEILSALGPNVYIKIPVMDTKGGYNYGLIGDFSYEKIQLNVTAATSTTHVHNLSKRLNKSVNTIVSVFAGRIADTGVQPAPIMKNCKALLNSSAWKLLWASTREVYNIIEAQECGCDIITVPNDILTKAEKTLGMDPDAVCLDTVQITC